MEDLDNLLEYFAPEIGWTPLAKKEARGKLTELINREVVKARIEELETLQVIDFEPDEQGEIEYMTLDEYLDYHIKELADTESNKEGVEVNDN